MDCRARKYAIPCSRCRPMRWRYARSVSGYRQPNLPSQSSTTRVRTNAGTARCRTGFIREGLIVAIINPGKGPPGPGGAATDATIPTFSLAPNDGLAEIIVQAWTNEDFRKKLLERDAQDPKKITDGAVKAATDSVNAAGFNLKRAVVISEKEHDQNYRMQDPTEVVFVLPDHERLRSPFVSGKSLLDTARLLMACTPNGI